MMCRDVGLIVGAWGGRHSPPPLVGLGREADQGWGEGLEAGSVRSPPSPRPLPQGEGEAGLRPRNIRNTAAFGPQP